MLVLTLVVSLVLISCSQQCPVWTVHVVRNTTELCQCGSSLDEVVDCDPQTGSISVMYCYCMTQTEDTNVTVVGSCITMCTSRSAPHSNIMNEIGTREVADLNEQTCGFANRMGQLCGRCIEGHGLPVYSYAISCVNCSAVNLKHNLLKYIAISFLPLTATYLVVVMFKVSVTSGRMVGYVLICQLSTIPTLTRIVARPETTTSLFGLFLIAFFSVWNLDFFRSLYTPFCIHPQMSTLHVLSLDYLVGVYPLVLIFLTYIAVILHDRYPIVVKMWSPAYRAFMCIRREWNIRGSLIQAFATFLVLSYIKILNVSFDLLLPVRLKTIDGKTVDQIYLYNNADITYFGKQHRPYGILAVIMLTVFNILPVLFLFLYPCLCFQKCLNCLHIQRNAVHIFMDAFQGCYRHQPRDCRYFAAIYFFVRILYSATLFLVRDTTTLAILGVYYLVLAGILVLAKPYAKKVHNTIDTILFLSQAVLCFVATLHICLKPDQPQINLYYMDMVTVYPAILIPMFYGVTVLSANFLPEKVCQFAKRWFRSIHSRAKHMDSDTSPRDALPDRIQDESSPLLNRI